MIQATTVATLEPGGRWSAPTVTIDATNFPLVVVHYLGAVRDEDFAAHLAAMTALGETRSTPIALVLDTTRGAARSVAAMRMLREWLTKSQERIEKRVAGLAIVLTDAVLRFTLSSVMLAIEMPYPYTVVETSEAGVAFARARLRDVSAA
jgi:hypothetical protein